MDVRICRLSILFLVLAGLQTVHPWSGHVCTRTKLNYIWYRYCSSYFWGWCTRHSYVRRVYYSFESYCCPGWKFSSYRVCSEPVCSPACRNGGTCIDPNICRCRAGYRGDICDGIASCSHLSPCYPGRCVGGGRCVCSANFTGRSCLTLQGDSFKADIEKVNATFAYYSYTKKEYAYEFMTDATDKTDIDYVWLNQEQFNRIDFDIDASIDSSFVLRDIPAKPTYIQRYKIGIVDARISVEHKKLGAGGEYVANTDEYICQHVSDTTPIANQLFKCRLHNRTNIIQLDSGDKYTLTTTVKTGGFRELRNPDTYTFYRRETYSGVKIHNVMEYRFDYDVPQHCIELKNCGPDDVPLKLDSDISRGSFTTYWKGWTDGSLSGIKRYVIEFWKMEYSKDYDGLREPEILPDYNPVPQYILELNATNTINYPEYQPTEPGVYSVILEVSDAANNSRYARQIVMYDDTSEISLDDNYRIYATSASQEADYVWQTTPNAEHGATTTIKISWKNRFINTLHHNNHFLSKILDFTHRLSDNVKRIDYKKIDPEFDDNESDRNKSAIHNINSIIQFETVHGTESSRPPAGWQIVNPLKQDATFTLSVDIRDGDSYQVWVRARDFMGNTKVDSTVIYFDSSEPNVYQPFFQPNVNDGKYDFSSRVILTSKDQESGIGKVSCKFAVNSTGEIKEQRDFEKPKEPRKQCERNPKGCYCIPKGDCFLIDTAFDINNCWMKVPLDGLKDEIHRLDITVYNMAMIPSTTSYNIGSVNSLRGVRDHSGPSNITIHKTTDSGLSISWVQAPTCYERAGILIRLFNPDNSTKDFKVHKDATTFDLTGLQAITKYRFELFTKYGTESKFVMSTASEDVKFTTLEKDVGILPGTIGGITAGFIILLTAVVIVLIFLGRTGRLQPAKARVTQGIRTIRNTVRVRDMSSRSLRGVNNRAYSTKLDDDIYFYGQMDVKTDNSLVLSRKDVSLESQLAQGRFATIYLANYYGNKRDAQTVVAKVLKEDQNEENVMKMKAKINFYTEKVGHHKNVLDFIGSVQDDVRGPFMVLEYCAKGVLKEFLIACRSNVTVDLEERLFRMVFGICLGMNYLSSKQVVHRRLAARNILLDHNYEPKIAGFGPAPTGDEEGEERIPIKWMAPECMKSTRHANELSDVFSYGVVMWEIFSLGDTPYPDIQSRDVPAKQKQGYKMKKPEYADDAFYQVMLKCWHYHPSKRDGFAQIKEQLTTMFQEGPGEDYYYRSNDI